MPRRRFRRDSYYDGGTFRGCCACCKDPIYLTCYALIACLITGALCITFGALYQPSRKLVDNRMARRVSVVPHAAILDQWTEVRTVNVTYSFFTVTNAEEVMWNGTIPELVEIGPFTYTKEQVRYNVYWNETQEVVLYDQDLSYVPIPHDGSLDPDETYITTLNVPMITLVNLYQNPVLKNDPANQNLLSILKLTFMFSDPLTEILSLEDLFITKSVTELLWGYKDPVFVKIKARAPSAPIPETFALQKNKIEIQNLMLSGKNDTSLKGEYIQWNGLTSIDQWGTPTARMINGSDGTIFGADVNSSNILYMFSDLTQRSFFFNYFNTTNLFGIDCYHYLLPAEVFSNETDPGFYANGPSGVLNLSAVEQYDAPFFVSKPHFLDADPWYLEQVHGLKPLPEKHEYYVDVEPITGTTFRDKKTSQYNILLQQYEGLGPFSNLSNVTMFPIFYSTESSEITEESSKVFKRIITETNVGTKVVISVLISVTGISCILTTVCAILCAPKAIRKCRRIQRQASMHKWPHQNGTNGIGEKTPLLDPDLSINT